MHLPAILASALSVAALCHPAMAVEDTSLSHIKVVPYSPTVRQTIIGIVGHPTVITFPPGEVIWRTVQTELKKDGAWSEDGGWQGPKQAELKDQNLGNNLPLWPHETDIITMTVITRLPDGSQKPYPLMLTAVPDGPMAMNTAAITLNLIYKGTEASAPPSPNVGNSVVTKPSGAIVQRVSQRTRETEQAAAEERLRTEAFNGADGACYYTAKGKKPNAITPKCPMDNGQWTLLRFPGLSKKPAAYVGTCEDGKDDERLARQHETGDFVVVEEIAPRFCLRLGGDVLDIINNHYDPVGNAPDTGTLTPSVHRELIQAKTK